MVQNPHVARSNARLQTGCNGLLCAGYLSRTRMPRRFLEKTIAIVISAAEILVCSASHAANTYPILRLLSKREMR